MNLNKVFLVGNLTADPELKNLTSGQAVCSFRLATNRVWTDRESGEKKQKAEFHNIVAWRKLAEICSQYLKKGSKIYVEGRLQTNEWTGQDGAKKYRTEIVADNMIMLDSKGGNFQPNQPSATPVIQQEKPVADDSEEIRVEDIPF